MQAIILQNPILQGFVYNVFVLMLRMFIAAQATGISKMIEMKKNKEKNLDESKSSVDSEEKKSIWASRAEVAGNIHRNDVENVSVFAMVCIPYVIVSSLSFGSLGNPQFALWNSIIGNILMGSFTLSRIVYFPIYWNNLQPWRTLVWFWGVLSTVLLSIYTIICMYIL